MMEYKGYVGRVEFDDEAGLFHGEVINARDVITFQGTTAEDIMREFRVSVDVYLEFCAEQGKAPDHPNTGHLVLDIAPELQAAMIQAARREHKNLGTKGPGSNSATDGRCTTIVGESVKFSG